MDHTLTIQLSEPVFQYFQEVADKAPPTTKRQFFTILLQLYHTIYLGTKENRGIAIVNSELRIVNCEL